MSILLKPPAAMNLPEGDVLLFCKGADSIILERLGKDSSKELSTLTTTHLELFANDGVFNCHS
jgi:phospholipid-translocating ATPase